MSRKKPTYVGGDRFNQKAREEGYRARSVYKLTDAQARFKVLAPGMRVLDLGCAPGSWSKYAREVVGGKGKVLGVDLQHVPSLAGVELIQADVFEVTPERLLEALGGPADVVLSDMAPNTTGDRFGDHVRQLEVARRALEIAGRVLRPGGNFFCKVFDGEDAHGFVLDIRSRFDVVKRLRPEAVRRTSVEFFVLGLGLLAPGPGESPPSS